MKTLLFGVFALAVLSVCLIATVGSAEDTDATEGTVYYDSNNNEYVVNNSVLTISKGTNGTGVMANFTSSATVSSLVLDPFTSLVIDDTITVIGQYAFNGNTDLVSVTWHDGITKFDSACFNECSNIASTNEMPSACTSIQYLPFTNCSKWHLCGDISNTTPHNSAFKGCTYATFTGNFPSSYATDAFSGCYNLAFSGTIKYIGQSTFRYCPVEITKITSAVTNIPDMFGSVTNTYAVEFESTTPATIGVGCFNPDTKFYVPASAVDTYKTAWGSEYADRIYAIVTEADYLVLQVGEYTIFDADITYCPSIISQSGNVVKGVSEGVGQMTVTVGSQSINVGVCVYKDNTTSDNNAKISYLSQQLSGKKISFLGDSISAPASSGNWPNTFLSLTGGTLGYINGSGGRYVDGNFTATSVIDTLKSNGTPDYVLVFGGTNDASGYSSTYDLPFDSTAEYAKSTALTYYADYGTGVDSYHNFIEAYAVMLWRIHNSMPDAEIVCIIPYCPSAYPLAYQYYGTNIPLLCDYLEETYDFNIDVVDLRNIQFWKPLYTDDGGHPNTTGGTYMARQIAYKLADAINGSPVTSGSVTWPTTSSATTGTGTDYTLSGISGAGQIGYWAEDFNASMSQSSDHTSVTFSPSTTGTSNYTLFETNRGTTKTFALTVNQTYYDSNQNEYTVSDGVLTVKKGTNGTGVMGTWYYGHYVTDLVGGGYTSVIIEDGITVVNGFKSDTTLVSVTLPNSVTSIEGSCFYGDTNLVITGSLPTSLTSIGGNAFYGCSKVAFTGTFPASFTTLGGGAFNGCTQLALSGSIPATLTSIDGWTFYGCSNVTFSGSLPATLTSIGEKAFTDCSKVTFSGSLPATLTTIGGGAFKGCTQLALSGSIPATLTTIGGGAFSGCSNVTFSGSLPSDLAEFNGRDTFYNCSKVTFSGSLPSGWTTIPIWSFNSTSVAFTGSLPANLTTIGECAFYGCTNLALSGSLPATLTSIGNEAFSGCCRCDFSGSLPATLTSIGNSALNTTSTQYFDVSATTPATLGTTVFWKGTTIYAPSDLLSAYQTAWSSYSSQITTHTNATVGDFIKIIVGEPCYLGYTITSYDNTKLSQSNGYITGLSQCVTEITYTVNSASVTKKVCVCKDYISDDYAEQLSELYDKYHGKKIAVMGDSISANPSQPTEWYNLFAYDVGATICSVSAINGSMVRAVSSLGVANAPPMVSYERINLLDDNGTPDFVFIFGGTNDQYLGTFDSSATYCNSLDSTSTTFSTFIEAYSVMLWRIHNLIPNATLVCIGPYCSSWASIDFTTAQMSDEIKELCDYLNDTTFSGLTTQFEIEFYSLSGLFDVSVYTSDNVHPSAPGEFYLEQTLEGLMEEGVVSSTVSWPTTSSATTSNGTDYTLSGITGAGQIGYYSSDANATVTSNTGNTAVTFTPTKTGTSNYTLFETNRGTTKTFALTVNQSYTVTFNTNGGSDVASQTIVSGQTATQPSTNPTKTGYTFAGWYSDSALTTQYVWTTPITQATTIYAKWTPITYTINYMLNATEVFGTDSYTAEAAKTLSTTTPSKTGYTFAGWYDNVNYAGSAVTEIPAGSTGAKIFYAKMALNSYSITYNVNGGSEIAAGTYTIESAKITLPTTSTKTGYAFAGWFTEQDLSGTAVTEIPTGSTGNKVFYAKWDLVNYTITYNVNGGTAIAAGTYTYTSAKITLPTPVKTGSAFKGWFTASDLSGTAVTEIASGSTGDKAFYAKWELNTYTVSFNSDGGSSVVLQTVSYGNKATAPANPTKDGCTFDGWYNGNTKYDFNSAVTSDVSLKAHWKANAEDNTLNIVLAIVGVVVILAGLAVMIFFDYRGVLIIILGGAIVVIGYLIL